MLVTIAGKIKSASSAHRAATNSGKVLLLVQQYWKFLRRERVWEISFLCQGHASGLYVSPIAHSTEEALSVYVLSNFLQRDLLAQKVAVIYSILNNVREICHARLKNRHSSVSSLV